jgi:hypothetical protein
MTSVYESRADSAPAERGVHAASASKMKAGWHMLALTDLVIEAG